MVLFRRVFSLVRILVNVPCLVHCCRSTVLAETTAEEKEQEYIQRFFQYHISNNTPPMAYLTWKTCQQTPALMTNEQLSGLDWDTITGLFDRVGAVKMMHVDTSTDHRVLGGTLRLRSILSRRDGGS